MLNAEWQKIQIVSYPRVIVLSSFMNFLLAEMPTVMKIAYYLRTENLRHTAKTFK